MLGKACSRHRPIMTAHPEVEAIGRPARLHRVTPVPRRCNASWISQSAAVLQAVAEEEVRTIVPGRAQLTPV